MKKFACFMSAFIGISFAVAGLDAAWKPYDGIGVTTFLALFFGGVGGLIVEAVIAIIARYKHIRFRITFLLLLFMPPLLIFAPVKIFILHSRHVERSRHEQIMEMLSRVKENPTGYRSLLEKVHNNTATDLETRVVKNLWRLQAPEELPFLVHKFMDDNYFILHVLYSDLLNEAIIREIYIAYAEKARLNCHVLDKMVSSTITPDDILSEISKQPDRYRNLSNIASRTLAKKTSRKYPDATTSNLIAAVQNKVVTEEHRVHAIELSKNGIIPEAEIDLLAGEFLKNAEFITDMLKHRQISPHLLRHVFDHYKKRLSSSSDKECADKIIHMIAESPQTPADILDEILADLNGFDGWIRGKARDNLRSYPRNRLSNIP